MILIKINVFINFNIIEIGGKTVKSQVQKSNPTATPGCPKDYCLACSEERGKGGQCHKSNVNYAIECLKCPEDNRPVYYGETSKNLYTRALQHMKMKDEEESFMRKHVSEKHQGEEGNFRAKVTCVNRDCMSRQVREGLDIRRNDRPLMNSKTEWFQPPIFRIQKDIVRH